MHDEYIQKKAFDHEHDKLSKVVITKLDEVGMFRSFNFIDKLQNVISELNEKIAIEIATAVRKTTKQESNKILQHVQKMTSNQSTSGDTSELQKLIDQKADKFQVIDLYDLKSNKADTETNMKAIDIIHKQIRHLIIMLMENFRVQVDTQHSNPQTRINRMNVVLQQSLLLAKWITKFNPENINSYDLTLPKDLEDFQEFVSQSMDEIAFTNIQSYQNKQALNRKANRMASAEASRTPAVKLAFK